MDQHPDREIPLLPYLSACVTFFYVPERISYLYEVVSHYIGLSNKSDIYIVTNTAEKDSLNLIVEALSPLRHKLHITFVIPSILGHPYLLTWVHREIFQRVLKSKDVTHFLYSEDDLKFTRSNVIYWLRYRPALRAHGLIPSFFRVERHPEKGWCSVDCLSPVRLYEQNKLTVEDGTQFFCMPNPYQGMYFLDRELMEEFASSPAMSPDFGPWNIREKAAQGLTFVHVPHGYTSRNVVPIDPRTKTVSHECWIHHLPNNCSTSQTSRFGKLSVRAESLFAARPDDLNAG